jgi:hypothetical protein
LPTIQGNAAGEGPSARFNHVHIDQVGPLHVPYGFLYYFTTIDRYTHLA